VGLAAAGRVFEVLEVENEITSKENAIVKTLLSLISQFQISISNTR
jgi:hypothetical protein